MLVEQHQIDHAGVALVQLEGFDGVSCLPDREAFLAQPSRQQNARQDVVLDKEDGGPQGSRRGNLSRRVPPMKLAIQRSADRMATLEKCSGHVPLPMWMFARRLPLPERLTGTGSL